MASHHALVAPCWCTEGSVYGTGCGKTASGEGCKTASGEGCKPVIPVLATRDLVLHYEVLLAVVVGSERDVDFATARQL